LGQLSACRAAPLRELGGPVRSPANLIASLDGRSNRQIQNREIQQGGVPMIVVMKPNATAAEIQEVIERAEALGVQTHPIYGAQRTVVALVGDLTRISRETFNALDSVHETVRIQEPYKLSSRSARPENTVVA